MNRSSLGNLASPAISDHIYLVGIPPLHFYMIFNPKLTNFKYISDDLSAIYGSVLSISATIGPLYSKFS